MKDFNDTIEIKSLNKIEGTGWIPSLPDIRDYTENHPQIANMMAKLGVSKDETSLPKRVDLREWFSPVEDQGSLGSCTANAAAGIVEYFENRAFGKYIDGSRLFVYKTTRNLLGWIGDTGAYERTTIGALALFGIPPEKYWPYTTDATFDKEPTAFVYSLADNYEAIKYWCHDPITYPTSLKKVLFNVKKFLACGIPSMFGFQIYSSMISSGGLFPFPCPNDIRVGGHAVVAAGYNDNMVIKNRNCGIETTGAFLIRNSWGTEWGDEGYGWIPYEYVLRGLAYDFWSLLCMEWVDTQNFGL